MFLAYGRRHWFDLLAIIAFSISGCSRGGPQAPPAIDFANLEKAEETLTKDFKTGAAPKVNVAVFNGPIIISAGGEGAVKAVITKTAGAKTKVEAEEALKELVVNFKEEADGLYIAAVSPAGKPFSGGVAAKLEVPAGASLQLKTSLGPVDIAGIHGAIRVSDSQGPINIKGGRSDLDLTTSLAEINVGTSSPKVIARNSQGAIVIRGATGDLDLATSLAPIEVDAPCASVTAKNSQGSITVNQAKGPLNLTTNLAPIRVNAANAELEAVNAQGEINAHGLKGRVKVKSNLAPITIEGKDAIVEAENSQGAVTFAGNLAAGKHLFRAKLGSVTLTLPASSSFHVDAQVSLGRIRNAFALNPKDKANDTRLLGAVGENPAAMVDVNVSQGDLVINKQ